MFRNIFKKRRKEKNFLRDLLYFEVSFFTGSMVLITAFIVAASAMPGPAKAPEKSALEAMITTFINDENMIQANIETEKLKVNISRNTP